MLLKFMILQLYVLLKCIGYKILYRLAISITDYRQAYEED